MRCRKILAAGLGLILLLGGCAGTAPETAEAPASVETGIRFSTADLVCNYENMVPLELSPDGEQTVISEGGIYRISGSAASSLVIDAEDQMVCLYLDGVTIRAASGPGIDVRSAGKVILTRAPETENLISDTAYYPEDAEEDAAVYAPCDLTINGEGKLVISGYFEDAVHTRDVFRLCGGSLELLAKGNGIHANDGVLVRNAELVIEAEKNGVETTHAGKRSKGLVDAEGVRGQITAGKFAVRSAADIRFVRNDLLLQGVLGGLDADGVIGGES